MEAILGSVGLTRKVDAFLYREGVGYVLAVSPRWYIRLFGASDEVYFAPDFGSQTLNFWKVRSAEKFERVMESSTAMEAMAIIRQA
jgi:hypothetical protein